MATPSALRDFQILQEVTGAQGTTYLARSKAGSLVVIREIGKDVGEDQGARLSKEASLGARLGNDAVLQTKVFLEGDRYAALVTELVPGISLQRVLRYAAGRGVRLPDVCALYILERVLTALASAHALTPQPVLHRMLVASSVVVGWDGTVKLGEFGLYKMLRIATENSEFGVGYTNDYLMLSPELARGEPASVPSDVYNAGLLAVRLLTGRTPFTKDRGANTELILAMVEGKVARFAKTRPDLAEGLRNALDGALEPDVAKRTVTAEELLAAVRASTDVAAGKAALAKLLERWRSGLEKSVTPWEARASLHDGAPEEETGLVKEGVLTLIVREERPSEPPAVAGLAADDERPLNPTDPVASLSRIGSIAPDALVMPLPAMRITMPSLPVYGGPAVNIPRPPPKQGLFTGKVAAAVVATMFIVLAAGTVILFRWLLHF